MYVACVIDVFARRIIGWRVATSMRNDQVLDALEQALRFRVDVRGVVQHSDRGSQYLSIRYSELLTEAGVEPSVGSVGESYDNALAETIIGLFKTEVIDPRPLALGGRRRVRHARIDRLIQQPASARIDRQRTRNGVGDAEPSLVGHEQLVCRRLGLGRALEIGERGELRGAIRSRSTAASRSCPIAAWRR